MLNRLDQGAPGRPTQGPIVLRTNGEVSKTRCTYRLRPGSVAEQALWAEEARNRWVWNQAYGARKVGAPRFDGKALTAARRQHEWLRAGSAVAQQQTLRDFHLRGSHHKARSKRDARPTLNYTGRNFVLRTTEKEGALRLIIPGGIVLPVVWSRDLPSRPSSVRVFRDRVGHWWASFVVEKPRSAPPTTQASIGIDWGLSAIATTTNPDFDLPHPRLGRKYAAQLAAAQRRMARRKPNPGQPASRGYKEAKRRAAVVHEHVRNARREVARDWARRLVAAHELIAVEDFHPRFMMKSRSLARTAADAGIGAAKTSLLEYAKRDGRRVVIVPPAYTTMDCSVCGARAKAQLSLSQRVFRCEECDTQLPRDFNAARNILARAGIDPAGGDDVRRLPPRKSVRGGAIRARNPAPQPVREDSSRDHHHPVRLQILYPEVRDMSANP